MKQTYGGRLAAALKLRGLKQLDLAGELGITQTAISKIINGSQYLDFDLAVKACAVLGVSLDWLAYGGFQPGREAAENQSFAVPPGTNPESRPPFYRNPDRQRIEYLMSILKEAEYPLVIVAIEEIIEIRLKDAQ
jgi:transcriptional regulator with XRE-family HTH domain